MPSIAELNVEIGGRIQGLQDALRKSERSLNHSARRLGGIADTLNRNFTFPLVAAAGAGVKFGADLESSFGKIRNLVGIGGRDLQELQTGVSKLSKPLAAVQTDLSDALFAVTSAGSRGKDALQTLEQASKASAIGLGDTTTVARTATAVVNTYGRANIDAATAIDQFTAAARVGNFEASEFAPSIGKVIPLANSLGISFAEAAANIATFTKNGVSAPEAVTGLKSLLSNLIKPTKETRAALKAVGLSVEELRNSIKEKGLAATLVELTQKFKGNEDQLARVIPNVEGLVNALATAGSQGEDYISNLRQIERATGIVDEGFKNVSETANFKFKQSLVGLQNASIKLGARFIPMATGIAEVIADLAEGFAGMDPAFQSVIFGFGGITAAAGITLKAISVSMSTYASFKGALGQLVKGLKSASGGFLAMDRVMKATVIGAVAAAVILLATNLDTLTGKLSTTEKAAVRLKDAQVEITTEYGKATRAVEQNFEVLNSARASTDEKKKAINELKAAYPGYLGNIDLENTKLSDLKVVQDNLNKSILRGIIQRKKFDTLEAYYQQIDELQVRLDELNRSGDLALKSSERQFGFAGAIKDQETQVKLAKANIEKEIKDLQSIIENQSKVFNDRLAKVTIDLPSASPNPGAPNPNGFDPIVSSDLDIETDEGTKPDKIVNKLQDKLNKLQDKLDKLPVLVRIKTEALDDTFEITSQLSDLTAELESQNLTRERSAQIIARLKEIDAGYFQSLQAGSTSVETIKNKVEEYSNSLQRQGTLVAAQEELLEIQKQLAAVDLGKPLENGETIAALQSQKESVEGLISSLVILEEQARKTSLSQIEAIKSIDKPLVETESSVRSFGESFSVFGEDGSAGSMLSFVDRAREGLNSYSNSVKLSVEHLNDMIAGLNQFQEPVGIIIPLMQNVASSITQASEQGKLSLKSLAKTALAAAAKFAKAKIVEAVAAAAAKTFVKNPLLGLVVAPVIGASVGAIFQGLISKIGIPALAEGGLASGPTLAVVGDNPNARVDPEVISPLSKLKSMMGGQSVEVMVGGQFRVQGTDLLLVLEKAQTKQSRIKGR